MRINQHTETVTTYDILDDDDQRIREGAIIEVHVHNEQRPYHLVFTEYDRSGPDHLLIGWDVQHLFGGGSDQRSMCLRIGEIASIKTMDVASCKEAVERLNMNELMAGVEPPPAGSSRAHDADPS